MVLVLVLRVPPGGPGNPEETKCGLAGPLMFPKHGYESKVGELTPEILLRISGGCHRRALDAMERVG